MSTKTELEAALKEAMLAKDNTAKNTLRLVLSAVKEAEVQKKDDLDDAEVLGILQKQVKTRQESLDEAQKAGRDDLAAAAETEIAILERFLPAGLSDVELEALVAKAIESVGAASPADMGAVMKALMPEVKGRADGGKVSQMVKARLQGS